jgi:hypothetical protein
MTKAHFYISLLFFIAMVTFLGEKLFAQDNKQAIINEAKSRKLLVVLEEGERSDSINKVIKEYVNKYWRFNNSIEFRQLSEIRELYEAKNKEYVILQLAGYSSGGGASTRNGSIVAGPTNYFFDRMRANEINPSHHGFTFRWEIFFIEHGDDFLYDIETRVPPISSLPIWKQESGKIDIEPYIPFYLKILNAELMNGTSNYAEVKKENCLLLPGKTLLFSKSSCDDQTQKAIKKNYTNKYKMAEDSEIRNAIMSANDTTAVIVLNTYYIGCYYVIDPKDGNRLGYSIYNRWTGAIDETVLKKFMQCK